MTKITVDTELVDSVEALQILKYWQPTSNHQPNTRHLKTFFDAGDLRTRVKVKNKWLYSKAELEALFLRLINQA